MSGRRRSAWALAAVGMVAGLLLLRTGPAAAQTDTVDQPGATTSTAPGEPAGVTTSTLPEDNSELGRIIPLPNSGRKPTSPGDRGGWQQITLFFTICAVIVAIGVYVWWRSRRNRRRLRAEGFDRSDWARTHGGDVRRGG